MSVFALIVITAVVLFVMWRILALVFDQLDQFFVAWREERECLCRKGAVCPVCPIHGWEKAGTEGPVELAIGADSSVSR